MGSIQHEDGHILDEPHDQILYINGIRHVLPDGLAHLTLLQYLRVEGLTGTKLGCGEGGCGACTVMVSYYDHCQKRTLHYAVNACLAPLYSVEGMHIVTIEGIGSCQRGLHPIQDTLAQSHGSQCGFCTPGFVMSMYSLQRSSESAPTEEQIEESISGNLCRCTGYRPIIDAFRLFSKREDAAYSCGSCCNASADKSICPSTGQPCFCSKMDVQGENASKGICSDRSQGISSDQSKRSLGEKELIFPPELLRRVIKPVCLKGAYGLTWYRATTLQHVLHLKAEHPDAKLVVGNTEVGIDMKLKHLQYNVLVYVAHVPELNMLRIGDDGLEIGAAVRISNLLDVLKELVQHRSEHETSSCKALMEQLRWFAGKQIRNVASVGGNVCTASPISDLNPLWVASRARFQIINAKEEIRTVFAGEFFLSYRKVDLANDEILLSIFLPWSRTYEFVKEFKQAHRREDDIALVNAGMRVHLEMRREKLFVLDASIVYGGVAAVPLLACKTINFLIGKAWDDELLQGALQVLPMDVFLQEDAPGGMVEFRKSLTLSFFFKFFTWVAYQLEEKGISRCWLQDNLSAIKPCDKIRSRGSQNYDIVKTGSAVGYPEVHISSKLQVSGEAEYADDTPVPSNMLHAGLIMSEMAHARILHIDDREARRSPGFMGLFLFKDVPGNNNIGVATVDEELFASDAVTCVGQVIGVTVADTHENAWLAARKVHIEYEELPAILSIDDAIRTNSFHPNTERLLEKGDVDSCFHLSNCDNISEGEVHVGGQEHFYLEPNCSLVWTVDSGNEVHMISSTQSPQKHQKQIAHVLGLPMSKVVCKTKRIGGGFGGKETRSAIFAAAASVPAYLLKKPVKITLDRDVDMKITGHRHSFFGRYKVGFTKEGRLVALDLELYNNGGNSLDLSLAVLDRAMFHSDNVYDVPNMRVKGRVCYTNFPSNTAFRGFGGPQGMLIAENWIERIALELQKAPEEIRELNFQRDGSLLHYGAQLKHCTLGKLWDELKVSSNLHEAHFAINLFNQKNRWKKRGMAMIPTKFGISFTAKHYNQAGALVQVYTDGTVLVTHGGVEMGQGLHTKIAQIAASAFDIPLNAVFISDTSTDKVPNASPTAASASSDMYGAAVLDACEQIKCRMAPVSSKFKCASFGELALRCYMERIDLSAHGFYATPGIGFDWKTCTGNPFYYYTYGAACAEVEIDTLTGDFYTRKADIILDLGHSLNPAIDVGQIEGAFVQGLGWIALEELKWGDSAHKWIKCGHLHTCGPGTYKIPSANDIPLKFNVSILKGVPNVKTIHSSKAVGEPPFFLASSVFFAIKDAIIAARAEQGVFGWFPLDNPATPERIRMSCVDNITKLFACLDFRPKLSV